jgi:glycosyltransferase involved in cell wall biosynthesis
VSGTPPDTTVVVMCYNERETLGPVAAELCAALAAAGRPWELLIVDDGSTDGSAEVARALAAGTPGVRVVRHPRNRGLGGVYRTGFIEARGDYVTFFPADGQFPPEILGAFRSAITDRDLVLGYLPERPGAPLSRLLSAVERVLYRVVVGPMPRFQGIMMFRRGLLDAVPLRSEGRGWGVVMEFVLRVWRSGHRVVSLPTRVRPRSHGRSKVNNLRTISANVRQMLALRRILAGR